MRQAAPATPRQSLREQGAAELRQRAARPVAQQALVLVGAAMPGEGLWQVWAGVAQPQLA